VLNVIDVRKIDIHTTKPTVPYPSCFEVRTAIKTLKKYKSAGSDQIPAELIKAGGETLVSAIHKLIKTIWNEKELQNEWKEYILPIHKKEIKQTYNYRGISLISNSYNILSNNLLSGLSPYEDETNEDHKCGFKRNISSTD
jgi:hypothetical protein